MLCDAILTGSVRLPPGFSRSIPMSIIVPTALPTAAPAARSLPDSIQLDVRPISCRQKHAIIFQRWAELGVGEHFVLVNDHDPVPLYYQFASQYPEAFSWDYLVAGPEEFQVKITRLRATTAPQSPIPTRCGTAHAVERPQPAGPAEVIVDARGLEAPEPMQRILAAWEQLPPGGTLRAHTDRHPIHLLPLLEARGVHPTSKEAADGSWITTLQRAGA
jgi:uncharacterized protein (DUF2249 family)